MTAGKPFRIKRQSEDGETVHAPTYNLCRCCYRHLDTPEATYCTPKCHAAHKRLAA